MSKMTHYTNFTSYDSSESLSIVNFLPSKSEVISSPARFHAIRNDKETLVIQLNPVRSRNDVTSSTLCRGTPESDMLAILARTRAPVTEVVTMFLIEASDGDIVYRSRACTLLIPHLLRTGKCDSCLGLLENVRHLDQSSQSKEGNVHLKYASSDTRDEDETAQNSQSEAPRLINFKKKLKREERRTPTEKVIECLKSYSRNEHLELLDPNDLKSDLVDSVKMEIDEDNEIHDLGEEEYLAIEQVNEQIHIKSEMSHHKGKSPNKKSGSKVKMLTSKCLFCAEIFRVGSVKFIKHVKLFHENESQTSAYKKFFLDNAPSICPQCGLECLNETSFQNHIGVCNGTKIIKCHICGKSIIAHHSQSFEKHLRRHEKGDTEVCPHCGRLFNNKQRLEDHISRCPATQTATQKGVFRCPSCEKAFSTNFKLDLHVRRVHKKEKSYACEHCGKSFFTERPLREHIISMHDKIKPFVCDICGFNTAKIDNLNLHRKKSHGVSSYIGVRAFWEMIQNGNHPYIDQNYEYLHLLRPRKKSQ